VPHGILVPAIFSLRGTYNVLETRNDDRTTPKSFRRKQRVVSLILTSFSSLMFCSFMLLMTGCSKRQYNEGTFVRNEGPFVVHKDLGLLPTGSLVRHTFNVVNDTDKPFEVLSVRKSCGCIETDVAPKTIVPKGGRLRFSLELRASTGGHQQGTLFVETSCSDAKLHEIVVKLEAKLPRAFWTEPESVVLTQCERTRSIRFHADNSEDLAMSLRVESVRGHLVVSETGRGVGFIDYEISVAEAAAVNFPAFDLLVFRCGRFELPVYQMKAQIE